MTRVKNIPVHKLKILVIVHVLLLSGRTKCQPISVSRGVDGDMVKFVSQDGSCREQVCSPTNATYLEDSGCVNDVDIRNHCE